MMQRRMPSFLLVCALAASLLAMPAQAQFTVRVFVDGDLVAFDQPPIVQGSRVLVPLRGVFERLGATVEWHPAARTVLAASGTTLVELQIGSRIARVNERAVTLDVPALIVRGRTLVPLRFVSEALGAAVEYRAADRTVLIWMGQAGPLPPPAPVPLPVARTIDGVITSVALPRSASGQARIVVESDNVEYQVSITAQTAITRVEAGTGDGGVVGAAALRPGDDVIVALRSGVAIRIRATYQMTAGRIDTIARPRQMIILTDGRTIRYVGGVDVLVNGLPAQGVGALRVGQIVEMRLNPTTREAWEINIISGAARVPTPEQMFLLVSTPVPGATVTNPIEIAGRTAPGARVEIVVTWFIGFQVGRQAVLADARGRFLTAVPVTVVATNTAYLVTVTATHSDLGREQEQFTVTIR